MKYIFVILLLLQSAEAILINEIMYDPEGDDNNKEYIEIIHEKNTSLENFTIEDAASSDKLKLAKKAESNFSLIVEDDFNYSEINASIYTVGSTIGNGLGNTGDTIIIKNISGDIADNITYEDSMGGKKGMSLCRNEILLIECIPTPGYENWIKNITIEINTTNGTPNETIINETKNETIKINYTIEITEVMANPLGDDRAPYPDGEWIEIYNYGNLEIKLDGFRIEDEKGNHLNVRQTNLIDGDIIRPREYKVVYFNGWSILNNAGDSVLLIKNNILDRVDYGPIEQSYSWSKIDSIWKKTIPTPGSANKENNLEIGPYAKIRKIYNDEIYFGDVVKIRADIYKGNSNKNSVKVYADDISDEISFNLFSKLTNISMNIPIYIKPNCDSRLKEGKYSIILEGFGEKDEELIEIKNKNLSFCGNGYKIEEDVNTKSLKVNLERSTKTEVRKDDEYQKPDFENLINRPEQAIIYKSSDAKAKDYAIYIFSFLLIIINVHSTIKEKK